MSTIGSGDLVIDELDENGNIIIDQCADVCPITIELGEVERIYDSLSSKIYTDMDKQYKEGKFNGPTYAETWAKLMSSVIGGALQAVVSLQNKETTADRAVKYESIEASKVKSKNDTCMAEASCSLSEAKEKAEDIKNGDEIADESLYGNNIKMVKSQTSLYYRQAKGFDDNQRQKYLDSLTGPFAILFQDLDDTSDQRPVCLQDVGIQSAANSVAGNMGPGLIPS